MSLLERFRNAGTDPDVAIGELQKASSSATAGISVDRRFGRGWLTLVSQAATR
jgi:hypothetical protein